MTEAANTQDALSLESSIPESAVPLDSILCTEELRHRPSRPPDYEKENRALMAIAGALADPKSNIFQRFAEVILEATQCDSSGLSLLTREDGGKRFYWPAIAGMWNPHIGSGTPRNFGPCGDVLDRNCTLLFKHFERRYPYFFPIMPLAEECLLVPFYVDGKAVGTIWAIMHTDRRRFDGEDERLMNTLGQFASLAYQTVDSIEGLRVQITAREKAEAELRRLASGLEAKVRRLVDANVIGIVIWNVEGAIIEANEAFLQMVQFSREELVSGRVHWTDLTPVEWRDRDARAIAELKATGIFQPFEKEYRRKDGSRVSVLIGGAFFEGSANEGVAFILDLSEQKHSAKVLRQAQEDLSRTQSEFAHVNRVMTMGELTASIAHEVTQPLTSIVSSGDSCVAWLANEPPNLKKARASAKRMVQGATRASEIVQSIRATFRKGTPTTASVDLNEVIEQTVPFVHGEAQRKNVSLPAALHAGIPSVNGDRVQLQQVLLNLMMNGIEAMARLDIEPKGLLIQSAVPDPREILVSIADTGPGIAPELAGRLFAPFFTTKPQGIGMGLRISRSIIEAHGGRLWAEKNEPRGAVFYFNLPIKTASA